MAIKFVLLVAVAFMAQLASSKDIPEYDTPYDAADVLSDTIKHNEMSHFLKEEKRSEAISCFGKQSKEFEKFGKDMNAKLKRAGKDIEKDVEGEDGKKAKKALEDIGASILDLSETFWPMVEAGEFKEALEKRKQVGYTVTEHAETFAGIIEGLTKTNSGVANKVLKNVGAIHKDAKGRSKTMSEAIRDCMLKN